MNPAQPPSAGTEARPDLEQERQRFEAWYRSTLLFSEMSPGLQREILNRRSDGSYRSVEPTWRGWLGRALHDA
jgi:hypothetical protein